MGSISSLRPEPDEGRLPRLPCGENSYDADLGPDTTESPGNFIRIIIKEFHRLIYFISKIHCVIFPFQNLAQLKLPFGIFIMI
jgi:hypothetical protein